MDRVFLCRCIMYIRYCTSYMKVIDAKPAKPASAPIVCRDDCGLTFGVTGPSTLFIRIKSIIHAQRF